MTLRLIQIVPDAASATVRKILDFKGIEYEAVDILTNLASPHTGTSEEKPEEPMDDPGASKCSNRASGHGSDVSPAADEVAAKKEHTDYQPMMKEALPMLKTADGLRLAGMDEIVSHLERQYPEPTLFPTGYAGIHRLLGQHFTLYLADLVLRAFLPDILGALKRHSVDSRSSEYLRWLENRKGDGWTTKALDTAAEDRKRLEELLGVLDPDLRERAFVLGRIGFADFCFYGALTYLSFAGESNWLARWPNVEAYLMRIERITASLPPE